MGTLVRNGLKYLHNLSFDTKDKLSLTINPLNANPTKLSNTLKQFVDFCRRIV